MLNARKTTTFLLAIIISASLISGYFCVMPPMAQAAAMVRQAVNAPLTDGMLVCHEEIDHADYFITSNDAAGGAIALCCVAKRENPDTGVLILSEWSPSDNSQPSASISFVDTTYDDQLILENFPISPPPVELLASVIKIE